MRRLLAGERSDDAGRQVRSKGFRLAFPPSTPPPIHLGALNQGMLALAGEVADGVWLNYVPVERIDTVVGIVRAAAQAAGRPEPEVLHSILCDVSDDPGRSRAEIRSLLTFYVSSPNYRAAFAWHGFEQEMVDAADAFSRRDREGVAKAITDELIDSIALIGTEGEVHDQMQRFIDGGVTSPSVCALDESRMEDTLGAFARRKV